jgi:hypothetical protein
MEGFIKVESEGVDQLLRDFREATGKPMGAFIADRSGAMGRYFAEATQPIAGLGASDPMKDQPDGFSIKAKQLGWAAVTRDISRVYSPPSKTYNDIQERHGQRLAKAFTALIKSGHYEDAKAMLERLGMRGAMLDIITFDGGALHQRNRNSRGRVNEGKKPVIVANPEALKHYVMKIKKRVGWAKSGWITAAKQIAKSRGYAGLPTWMRQPAPGSGTDRSMNKENPHVILQNLVRYMGDLVPERYITRANTAFEESLEKELKIILEKVAQKNAALLKVA